MLSWVVSRNDAREAVPSLLTGGKHPSVAGTAFPLSLIGYTQAEYALSGRARAFERTLAGLNPVEEAEFVTRIIVYRPTESATFNGTVWIEWLNVSGGLDAAPGWIFTHKELVRRGAAWVGVSAQQIGVEGGVGLVGMRSPGLIGSDPSRYGGLRHPGDRFSYDMFSQASAVVRSAAGTILDGLPIERVIATGDSQSAFRLTTYVNDIDPLSELLDGFMVHARGATGAPLDDEADPRAVLRGDPVFFREDLRVPVLCVEAETDLINLGYLSSRQDDSEMLTCWEIAGASHADIYTFVVGPIDTGQLSIEKLARAWLPVTEIFGMKLDKPVNTGPQHYVRSSAVSQLERWVRGGSRPSGSPRLEIREGAFVTDDVGNVRGGIRTPHVDVPVSTLSGLGNGGHPISFLCGCTVPFATSQLRDLYSSPADYLKRFRSATESALEAGFLLADDAAEVVGIAESNATF
jgi:hypothetical protein